MTKSLQKSWNRVSIQCPPDAFELVHSVLFQMGAGGTEEQPDTVIGYFPGERSHNSLKIEFFRSLKQFYISPSIISSIKFDTMPEENWGETWNRFFQPIRISDRLVIKPPWLDWMGPEPVVIDIMPKMAFGTGTHETTQLCLEMMEPLITSNCSVLDVGTGSGILSIAAARLGATLCTGIDVDEDAIENALENAGKNGVAANILFFTGSLDLIQDICFDLILANIQSGILIPIIPDIKNRMCAGSVVIFSGILKEETAMFQSKIESNSLSVIQIRQKGEWMALQCQITGSGQ